MRPQDDRFDRGDPVQTVHEVECVDDSTIQENRDGHRQGRNGATGPRNGRSMTTEKSLTEGWRQGGDDDLDANRKPRGKRPELVCARPERPGTLPPQDHETPRSEIDARKEHSRQDRHTWRTAVSRGRLTWGCARSERPASFRRRLICLSNGRENRRDHQRAKEHEYKSHLIRRYHSAVALNPSDSEKGRSQFKRCSILLVSTRRESSSDRPPLSFP